MLERSPQQQCIELFVDSMLDLAMQLETQFASKRSKTQVEMSRGAVYRLYDCCPMLRLKMH